MIRQLEVLGTVLLVTLLFTPSSSAGSMPIDDVNGDQPPANLVYDIFGNNEGIGWVYVPDSGYLLDGISSTFHAITNPAPATRDVTLSIYDDVPAGGGNLLRTGTFSAGPAGGDLGVTFAPIQLEGGEDYFIAFENIDGLGLNVVDFDISFLDPNTTNPDVSFLSGWYTGTNFDTFIPHTAATPAGFAAPILRFQGVVPEPSTLVLAVLGLVTIGWKRLRTFP